MARAYRDGSQNVAVGPSTLPQLHPVAGIRVGVTSAGIKVAGRQDLVLFELAPGSHTAGVFTRNAFCAAPVILAKANLAASHAQPRYWLINTGNANAGTGAQGLAAAQACVDKVAALAAVPSCEVLPFSTGVIGESLPIERIIRTLPDLFDALDDDSWEEAAVGIMTTDTRPKGTSRTVEHDGTTYTVTGIAKGAGMLRPDMATMLAYIATDAAIAPPALNAMLKSSVEQSFHRITVDGDTSTNDACILAATGAAGNAPVESATSPLGVKLACAVEAVCIELATGLVRDGEGASKFVSIVVAGGRDEQECLDVAFTIAHSPLVKTALFASDPNWGRLLAAIGRAGLPQLEVEKIGVVLNDILIAEGGCRAAGYTEEQGVAAMAADDIEIRVELNRGDAAATVWTTDFSYDYVQINAEYRT